MAGVIPGILVGIGLFIAGMYVRKRDIQKGIFNDSVEATKQKSTGKERWDAFIKALPGLMIPVIILGGIYGGFFTPTEAAVIAVVYGLINESKLSMKGIKSGDEVRIWYSEILESNPAKIKVIRIEKL